MIDQYTGDEFEDEEPLYETEAYQVEVGLFRIGEWEGVIGYLIRNKATWVVEGEINVFHAACEVADNLTQDLADYQGKVIRSPEDPEAAFEDALGRLKDKDVTE